jgi:hypothetical protein
MNRSVYMMFVCGLVLSGQALGNSGSGKHKYLDWLRAIGGLDGALIAAPNGCWQAGSYANFRHVKRKALSRCRERCDRIWEIEDVDGTTFIKQKGSSSCSTSSSSRASTLASIRFWCAPSGGVAAIHPVTCKVWARKAYKQKYLAEAEHKLSHDTDPRPYGLNRR